MPHLVSPLWKSDKQKKTSLYHKRQALKLAFFSNLKKPNTMEYLHQQFGMITPFKPKKTDLDKLLDYIIDRNPEGFKKVLSQNAYPISNDRNDLLEKAQKLIATDPFGLEKLLIAHPDLEVILELLESQQDEPDNKEVPKDNRDDVKDIFDKISQKLDNKEAPKPKVEEDKMSTQSIYEKHKSDFILAGVVFIILMVGFVIGRMD